MRALRDKSGESAFGIDLLGRQKQREQRQRGPNSTRPIPRRHLLVSFRGMEWEVWRQPICSPEPPSR